MKKLYYVMVLILVLASCSPSPEAVQKAMTQTMAALPPTATPTPIPLSELNLEPVLFQEGDLPPGYYGGEKGPLPADAAKWITDKGIKNFNQDLMFGADTAGFVTIYLYEDLAQVDVTYSQQVGSFGDNNVSNLIQVGEAASYVTFSGEVYGVKMEVMQLVFTRCHSVVNILITNSADPDLLASYAKKIDQRISELVCR